MMDEFRKTLKKRVLFGGLFVLLAAGIFVWGFCWLQSAGSAARELAWMRGFEIGAFTGLALVCAAYIVQALRALADEGRLKKLYIEEHDERALLIEEKSGGFAVTLILAGFALAQLAASFVDARLFAVLLLSTIFVLAVKLAMRLSCMLRYTDPGSARLLAAAKGLVGGGLLLVVLVQVVDRFAAPVSSPVLFVAMGLGAALLLAGLAVFVRAKCAERAQNREE